MSGEMTDARREAMGWRKCGLEVWEHDVVRGDQWHQGGVDVVVPLQEEIAHLKAELAELRKPAAPTEWAAGQVWRFHDGELPLLIMQAPGRLLCTGQIDEKTGVLTYPHCGFGEITGEPVPDDGDYLGMYHELYEVKS